MRDSVRYNLSVAAACTRDLAQALALFARARTINPFWPDMANAEARLDEVLHCNDDGLERAALPRTAALLDAYRAWRKAQGAEFDAFARLQKALDEVRKEVLEARED